MSQKFHLLTLLSTENYNLWNATTTQNCTKHRFSFAAVLPACVCFVQFSDVVCSMLLLSSSLSEFDCSVYRENRCARCEGTHIALIISHFKTHGEIKVTTITKRVSVLHYFFFLRPCIISRIVFLTVNFFFQLSALIWNILPRTSSIFFRYSFFSSCWFFFSDFILTYK